ncbi:hypothetical protein [Rhodoplanes roseus]|uniref:Uncharacterized protein n=1 Tax=Rhodoplanes roseus TaxID=29409 RepID=A0A327L1F8_9BRAD|nr:hypothetical protein [Rhodoplanes roseus]RAI43795.1 hypothetical protein CH341_12460 [Rhodoplanes roseus]
MPIRTTLSILAGAGLALLWGVVAYPVIDWADNALYWRRVRAGSDVAELVGHLGNNTFFEFSRAAAKAGLRRSDTIKGVVDNATLQPDGRLRLFGWAVDTHKGNKPVDVFLIAPKVAVFMVQTSRSRDDVADVFLFPRDYIKAGFETTFDHKVDCAVARAAPYVVVVNQDLEYDIVNPQVKIAGC